VDLQPWLRPRFLAVPAILIFLSLYVFGAFDGSGAPVFVPTGLDVVNEAGQRAEPSPARR
jgi:hypothetical protein